MPFFIFANAREAEFGVAAHPDDVARHVVNLDFLSRYAGPELLARVYAPKKRPEEREESVLVND
ncbi:hypothetical protein GCM10027321_28350 [Massilia terrae]